MNSDKSKGHRVRSFLSWPCALLESVWFNGMEFLWKIFLPEVSVVFKCEPQFLLFFVWNVGPFWRSGKQSCEWARGVEVGQVYAISRISLQRLPVQWRVLRSWQWLVLSSKMSRKSKFKVNIKENYNKRFTGFFASESIVNKNNF